MTTPKIHIVEDNSEIISSLKSKKEKFIVFKEDFSNGEVTKKVGSDAFWKKRYSYFEKEGISKLEYFDSVIKPVTTLQNMPKNTSIFLWFSTAKRSKINVLMLLTFLLFYYRKDISYYLITIKDSENDFQELMQNKERLSRNKLLKAQKQWELFVEDTLLQR